MLTGSTACSREVTRSMELQLRHPKDFQVPQQSPCRDAPSSSSPPRHFARAEQPTPLLWAAAKRPAPGLGMARGHFVRCAKNSGATLADVCLLVDLSHEAVGFFFFPPLQNICCTLPPVGSCCAAPRGIGSLVSLSSPSRGLRAGGEKQARWKLGSSARGVRLMRHQPRLNDFTQL